MALKITVEIEWPSTIAGINSGKEVIYSEAPISYTELERIIRRLFPYHNMWMKSILGVEVIEKPEDNKKVAGQSKVN